MPSTKPVCLTIAGSDSGGGAGIQADLRAFADFDVFAVTVVTAVTAQNPSAVTAIHAVPVEVVVRQYEAVRQAFGIGAIKTGMLGTAAVIRAVADGLRQTPEPAPLVVDPVMAATSGARLLDEDAGEALASRLLPLATVITPNLGEAECLLGQRIANRDASVAAARELALRYGTSVLLKGGHRAGEQAIDVLATRDALYALAAPFVKAPTSHGSGCALSAAIAAGLALGEDLVAAVRAAKAYVSHSLLHGCRVGPRSHARYTPAPRRGEPSTVSVTEL